MGSAALSARQAQIVEAAMRVLATRGARRFTVQLLAAEVGVTGGAIYRHFPSMETVGDAVFARIETILFEGFPPKDPDPLARLRAFFLRRTRTILDHPHVSRLLLSDCRTGKTGAVPVERLDQYRRRSREFVVGCLREAKRRGMLAGGASAEAGAVLVLGSILALAHAGTRIVGEDRAPRLVEEIWGTIESALRGLRPSSASGKRPRRRRGKGEGGRAGSERRGSRR